MITLKSAHEIELMRRAGKITAAARAVACLCTAYCTFWVTITRKKTIKKSCGKEKKKSWLIWRFHAESKNPRRGQKARKRTGKRAAGLPLQEEVNSEPQFDRITRNAETEQEVTKCCTEIYT